MGAAEAGFGEDRIGLRGEVAIGVEQQFHALTQFLLAQEQRIDPGFYVSHVDTTMYRMLRLMPRYKT
jgi:hypothetical protein